ncbi:glycosyltransferase [Paraburkholderia sp. DHOC27]|uniref:glycosyltransferase family 2 protein n=1 Tax=Paraburkholderia sp. DHOC27 TaxID=2303330 RepID=UPI0015F34C2A|nr:glycosyltransferase [Paraburkholderia sp. DHOC27]
MTTPGSPLTLATIIPCHNSAVTLARAITSALSQPELDELLVVIDASHDDSLRIAQRFEQDDSRVRAIDVATQGGPAQTRNFGAAAATSDILCFLDADDEHLPGFYGFAKQVFATLPQWAGLKCGTEIVDLPEGLSLDDTDPRYDGVLASAPWNLAVRKPVFWMAGGFPQGSVFRGKLGGEDLALNRALRHNFDVAFTELKFCRHYNRPGSHLEQYLRRTSVVDGSVVFATSLPEELDGSMDLALSQHVERAASNQSLQSLQKTQT